MITAESQIRPRDFGTIGTVLMAVCCLLAGGFLGHYVYLDGAAGLRNTYTTLFQGLLPGAHYTPTILLSSVIICLTIALSMLHQVWSVERMILLVTALLLVADVIPGLSILLGMLLLGKLFGSILRTGDAKWPLSPVGLMVLLILMAYSTTFLNSDSPVSTLSNFLPRLPYIVLALFLPIAVNTTAKLERLVDYLILAALFSLGVELFQGIASPLTGLNLTFGPPDLETFDAPWGATLRLTGLMTHPNRYSNVTATVGIIVLWYALQPKALISRNRRLMMWIIFFMLSFGVLASWSRSGWLAYGIAGLCLPFFRWPHLTPLFLGVGGILTFIGFSSGAIEVVYTYVRDLSRASADFRWHIDQIGLQAFFEHPKIGIGIEGTKQFFNAYELQVHNAPIQILADLGLAGVAAFSALMLSIFVTITRVATSSIVNPRLRSLALALAVASIVTLAQGFVEVFLWLKFLWTFIAVLGCVYVAYQDEMENLRTPTSTASSLPSDALLSS